MSRLALIAVVLSLAVPHAQGQDIEQFSERGPRFLLASATNRSQITRVDVARTPVLRRRVTIDYEAVTLDEALKRLAQSAGLQLAYSTAVIPVSKTVSLKAQGITVAAALTELLIDADVDILFSTSGQAVLVRKNVAPPEVAPAVGIVAGRVTEAKTGYAVPAAQVTVAGTSLGRTTDDSGRYTIAGVPAGTRAVNVRRLGYDPASKEVAVRDGESATLDFELVGATTRLSEIVTTVTGGQRRVELGHTIATVNADSLMQSAPVMNFNDLLQGRAPGVFSITQSNKSGQAGAIRLRGLNSFGVPNDPIMVIDGVRVEATTGNCDCFFGATQSATTVGGYTGRLSDLDPAEIASVEIVRGPSAATLYGTDAANGVVVVTTKRGQAGRARWTAFTEHGILEQRLDEWDRLDPTYAFGRNTTTGAQQRCTLLQRAAGRCVLDSLVSFNSFTHPDTKPFKNGSREEYGLQLSGGANGGSTYFLSGGYEKEIGTWHMPSSDQRFLRLERGVTELPDWQLRPNAIERVNLRGNLTSAIGARGSITLATSFISNQGRQPSGGLSGGQVGYRDVNDGWSGGVRPGYSFSGRGEDVVRRFTGSITTTNSVRDWITLRASLGADMSANASGLTIRRGEKLAFGNDAGLRTIDERTIARYSVDFGATAVRPLSAALSSKTSAGMQYNRRAERGIQVIARDLPVGGETSAGATDWTYFGFIPPAEQTRTTAVAGGYVEELIGFRDRLFLTGALRFDGGSAFGQNFSLAVYPKASISWVVTDGQVGPHLPGVSTLRLRTAYGVSGVQPGPTAALQQMRPVAGVSGNAAVPAAQLGQFGNPNLKPERASEIEAGVDVQLTALAGRLELTAYQRTNHDALINRELAPDVGGGFGSAVGRRWENLGSVRNRGLELLLSSDVVRGDAISAGVTVTGSLNDNKLLELGKGIVVSSPASQGNRQDVGYPLQGLWGRTLERYSDANGNGIIEPTEIVLSENHYIGPAFPTREATAAPYVGLFRERLRLSALLHYRGGNYVQSPIGGPTCSSQYCRAVNDISTPLSEQARAVSYSQFFASGEFTEPASYVMLREVSMNFTAPPKWARMVRSRDARLVVAGRNVAQIWRQGTTTAVENDGISRGDRAFSFASITGGAPTYWVLRLHVTY